MPVARQGPAFCIYVRKRFTHVSYFRRVIQLESRPHMSNLYHPDRKDFQLERMVLFSDAVFAIAITLLIIEIKVPHLHGLEITDRAFVHALIPLIPEFFGFIFSFFIIGLYWFIHHTIFGFVVNYTKKLIWLNLLFLFSIVLMPFSTAVYSEYSSPKYIFLIYPYCIYVFNICLTGFLNYTLWVYISNPKNKVAEGIPGGDFIKNAKTRSLLLPSIFLLSLLVSIVVNGPIGRFVLLLIPLFMSFVKDKKEVRGENDEVRSEK